MIMRVSVGQMRRLLADKKAAPVRARKKPVQHEAREQAILVQDFAKLHPRCVQHLFHIPNGGLRPKKVNSNGRTYCPEGKKLLAMGAVKGASDLCLAIPIGDWHGMYLEMKWGKGTVSTDQDAFLRSRALHNYAVAVAWSAKEGLEKLQTYMRGQHLQFFDWKVV
jgi:hypothetical protein